MRTKLTNNQKIETSREIRQWIKGIIVPTVAGCLYLDWRYPGLKYSIRDFCKDRVDGFKDCFFGTQVTENRDNKVKEEMDA